MKGQLNNWHCSCTGFLGDCMDGGCTHKRQGRGTDWNTKTAVGKETHKYRRWKLGLRIPPHFSNPVKLILSNISFWLSVSFFHQDFLLICPMLCWLWCQQSWNNIGCHDLSHYSSLWEDICFTIWFLGQILILPSPGLNTPYDLTIAMCSEYPATDLTTTIQTFWICCQV